MARRHHRRRNPSSEEIVTIALAAAGGALATYVYMNSIQKAGANTATVSATLPPAGGTSNSGS